MTEHVRQHRALTKNRVLRAWSVSFPDPIAAGGVRGDRARGMVANVSEGGEKVRNDFDSVSIYQRPIFNATWDDATCRWVDLVGQGEEGFTFSPTEKNREVVYRCTPFWYRVEYSADNELSFVSVTDKPLKGYKLAPMFKDSKSYEYRPCFEMSYGSDGKPHSRAGFFPIITTPATIMRAVRALGKNARTENIADWFSDYILMLVEFATRNLQDVMQGAQLTRANVLLNESDECDLPLGIYVDFPDEVEIGAFMKMTYHDENDEYHERKLEVLAVGSEETELGYYVTVDADDIESIIENGSMIELIYAPCRTGTVLPYLMASSGKIRARGQLPCAWRGKENPWGNVSSLICDMLFEVKGDLEMDVYRLSDPQKLDGTRNEYYSKLGTRNIFFLGNYMEWGIIKSYTCIGEDYILVPEMTVQEYSKRYWAARAAIMPSAREGGIRYLRVGGDYETMLMDNAGCYELLGGKYLSDFGARLIMEEVSE